MSEYWSWSLTALGLVGLWLAGSKRRVGWVFGIAVQPVWIVFAIATHQYGFVLSAAMYGLVYARNWWRWHAEQRSTPEPDPLPYELRNGALVIRARDLPDGYEPPSASLRPAHPTYRMEDSTPTAEDLLTQLHPREPKPPLGPLWSADFAQPPKYVIDALEQAVDDRVRAAFAAREAAAQVELDVNGVGDVDPVALARAVTRLRGRP